MTEPYGPIADEGGKTFQYYENSDAEWYCGQYACYHGGGYMEALTSNYTISMGKLNIMRSDNWLDAGARVIMFEFTLYAPNTELGLYAVCRISFEISATNLWRTTFDVDILQQRHIAALGFRTGVESHINKGCFSMLPSTEGPLRRSANTR